MIRRIGMAALALGGCVAITACGSSHSTGASGPVSAALSYFPSTSPVIATVDTGDKGTATKSLQSLQRQEPDLGVLKAALFAELAKSGVNYNQDVKPLFGTPITLGVGAGYVRGNATPFLLAWQTNSQAALQHLVTDLNGLTKTSTHDGATLYTFHGLAFAVDGSLLLVSQNAANLDAALDRHGAGNGFPAKQYDADTSGLPSDAPLSVVGNLQSVLDTPSTAQARKVPWVAAITGYGVALSESTKNIALNFRVTTGGRSLSADQLPIAQGASAPALATDSGDPIAFGLRDPAQIWTFVKATEQAVDPSGYAKLTHQEQTASQKTGVDIESFVDSLTGDVQLTSTGHVTIGRIQTSPSDAARWEKLLANPGSGSTSVSLGGGFYRLTENDGTTLVGGTAGNQLVLGNGTPAQERTYASASSTPSHGTGAVAYEVAVGQLVRLALSRSADASNPFVKQLGSMLGNLSGSVQVTPQALTGTASLALNPSGS